MKFLKKVVVYSLVAAGGYFDYKKVMRIREVMKLDKQLPEFLKNITGEKPRIHINMMFTSITIKLGFSEPLIEQDLDIKAIVTEYVDDFYPALAQCRINISTYACEEEECECDDDVCEENAECCTSACGCEEIIPEEEEEIKAEESAE